MMTRSGGAKFPCQGMSWHYARMQRSVFQEFDPLDRLREAAAAREAAGLRRRLVPRSPGDQGLDLDTAAVATALACRPEAAALVVTDAVFSVTGELAPLAALHAIARRHRALLVVDEAHSFGVLGDGGRGAAHDAGIAADPALVRTITLSKSLAGQGGAVLAAGEVTQTLVDTGRGFIFDTGLAPPAAGAALAALHLLRADPPAAWPGAAGRQSAGRRRGGAGPGRHRSRRRRRRDPPR